MLSRAIFGNSGNSVPKLTRPDRIVSQKYMTLSAMVTALLGNGLEQP